MKKINKKTVIKAAYLAGGLATAAHFVVHGAVPGFKGSDDKCLAAISCVMATAGAIVVWPVYLYGLLYTNKSTK